jgi:hypothetical protein
MAEPQPEEVGPIDRVDLDWRGRQPTADDNVRCS